MPGDEIVVVYEWVNPDPNGLFKNVFMQEIVKNLGDGNRFIRSLPKGCGYAIYKRQLIRVGKA